MSEDCKIDFKEGEDKFMINKLAELILDKIEVILEKKLVNVDKTIKSSVQEYLLKEKNDLRNEEDLLRERGRVQDLEKLLSIKEDDIKVKESELKEVREKLTNKKEEVINEKYEILQLEEKNSKLEDEVERLKNKCKDSENEIQEISNELNSKVQTIEEINEQKEKLEKNLSNKSELISCLESKNQENENIIKSKLEEILTLNNEASNQNELISDKERIITNMEAELQIIKEEIEKERNTNNYLEEKINNLNNEISSLEIKVVDRDETIRREENRANSAIEENDGLKDKFGNFDEVTKPYTEIMNKVYSCESLNGLIAKYHLENKKENINNTDNILNFIGVFGTDINFAKEVYNTIREYKKNNREALNINEKDVFNELNLFYKEKYQIEFNILDTLDEKMREEKPRFDKNIVQDIDRASSTSFRYIDEIYVPALYTVDQKIQFKAIIKGN